MGNHVRLKQCGALVVGAVAIASVIALWAWGAEAQRKQAEQACPYEKYFEHQGGGVYHLELDKFFEENGAKELDTTRTTAKIMACWREAHRKEFRIVGISYMLHVQYPPFIIITEPVVK